jgi:YVTN family beta-propeller protein
VIDTTTNTVVAIVPVGVGPVAVAITPNGALVYVANSASNTVSVIGTATNAVMTTVTVTWAPDGVATTPDGAFAYVVNEFANTLSVIDSTTNTVVDAVQGVAMYPVGIAIMHSSNMPTLKCR